MFGGQIPIQVTVSPQANEESPVAVDLVVVYDEKLLGKLLEMPAATWFIQRPQILRDYADALTLEGREWVPGQEVSPLVIPYRAGARRVLVFADYGTEGDHRAAVDPQQPFRLILGERDLAVEAVR